MHRNLKTYSSIFRLLFSVPLFAACGQSDTVQLKLLTGLEANPVKNFFEMNPKQAFSALVSIPAGQTCIQRNLYAGFQIGDDDTTLQTFPIRARTPSNAGALDATWVKNNALIDPITLRVPKGLKVTVGVVGYLIRSQDYDVDGVSCAPYTLSGGGVWQIQDTASVIGYTEITPSSNQVITLQTWMLDAAPNAVPTIPVGANCQANQTTDCPGKDFVKIFPATSSTIPFIAELEYFKGSNQPQGIKQLVQYTALSDFKYIADHKGMIVHFRSPTGTLLGTSAFSDQFPNIASIISGVTYKLNLKNPVSSGSQNGLFVFSAQQSGSSFLLNWSAPASITSFDVQTSISVNGPFTTVHTTGTNSYLASPPLGTVTYYRVVANVDALTIESSPIQTLLLSTPGAASPTSIANGANFALPTVTGATIAEYQYQVVPAGAWSAWQTCSSTSFCTVFTGSSGNYNAKFAFKNNLNGYVETPPISFTAL